MSPLPAARKILRLTQLLRFARLTPGQALLIAADLLAEVADRHAQGRACGGFTPDAVRFDVLGTTLLAVPSTPSSADEPYRADLRAARAVLTLLLEGAQPASSPAVNQPDSPNTRDASSQALSQAIETLSHSQDPRAATTILRQASTATEPVVRGELSRLVRSIGHSSQLPPATPRPQEHPPAEKPPPTPPAKRRLRRWLEGISEFFGIARAGARAAISGSGMSALTMAILVAILLAELTMLRGQIAADIDRLLHAGGSNTASGGDADPAATAPPAPPVRPPAPASAGAVLGVDLRPLRQCAPANPCELRVLIQLGPTPTPHQGKPEASPRQAQLAANPTQTQPNTPSSQPPPTPNPEHARWHFRVVDRCTGWSTDLPGGQLLVPPNGGRATAVVTVPLPAATALAVMAITETPAVAASRPLSVPVSASCSPRR